jgi:hypothetical protein
MLLLALFTCAFLFWRNRNYTSIRLITARDKSTPLCGANIVELVELMALKPSQFGAVQLVENLNVIKIVLVLSTFFKHQHK